MKYHCKLRCPRCNETFFNDLPKNPLYSDPYVYCTCANCQGFERHKCVEATKMLGLRDRWPWRPHKGRPVEDVILTDPGAVRWAIGEDPDKGPKRPILLDNAAYEFYQKQPL